MAAVMEDILRFSLLVTNMQPTIRRCVKLLIYVVTYGTATVIHAYLPRLLTICEA